MKYFLSVIALFVFGCADVEPDVVGFDVDKPSPLKSDVGRSIGSACAEGCVWSNFAIAIGAQEATAACDGVPCTCVRDGDVYLSCSPGSVSESEPDPEANPTPEPEPDIRPLKEVPYFFQYLNRLNPGQSCQNTSIAMVLSYLGWEGVPDDITREWGKDFAQEPGNLRYLFNTLATEHFLGGALSTTTVGTLDQFRRTIDSGAIVIVHGYFTSYGHVLVVTGRTEDGDYIVNDPAGRWSEVFRGGYLPSGVNTGHGIVYDMDQFEAAVSTSDGAGFLPLWFHVLREF